MSDYSQMTVDDIRTGIIARLEHAQKDVATAELHLRTAYMVAGEIQAELRAHDRVVAAVLAAQPAAEDRPAASGTKEKARQFRRRLPRLYGKKLDERRKMVAAAYKRGVPTKEIAGECGVSSVRILQMVAEYEKKTGEKIERHWQARLRLPAEPGGSNISVETVHSLVS